MTAAPSIYGELQTMLSDRHHNEERCREYLQYTKYLLFSEFTRVLDFIHFDSEYRLTSGDVDVAISARIRDEDGTECKRAYVWELKPAQVAIFKKETQNRFIPTMELIKAENQLLHYYLEARGNSDFRSAFEVNENQVCLGGIIISRDNNKIQSCNLTPDRAADLYDKAKRARLQLYSKSGIRLLTWDRVLEHLRAPQYTAAPATGLAQIGELQTIPEGTITVDTATP